MVFRQNISHKFCIKIDIVFLKTPLQITNKYRFSKQFRFSQQADCRHYRDIVCKQTICKCLCRSTRRHDVFDNNDMFLGTKLTISFQGITSRHERTFYQKNIFHRLYIIGICNLFPNENLPRFQISLEPLRQGNGKLISATGRRNCHKADIFHPLDTFRDFSRKLWPPKLLNNMSSIDDTPPASIIFRGLPVRGVPQGMSRLRRRCYPILPVGCVILHNRFP